MKRSPYYEDLKTLARLTRDKYGLSPIRVLKSDLRQIFKAEGVRVDLWPHKFRNLRGAYFDDQHGPSVMIASGLPDDPTIFTMAHELKHHLADRDRGRTLCASTNESDPIEIGAEVFAAELLFAEAEFISRLVQLGAGSGTCPPEVLVQLKHDTKTTLSYAGLSKRAEFLGFAAPKSLARVKWKAVEESLYGVPIYKRLSTRRIRMPVF